MGRHSMTSKFKLLAGHTPKRSNSRYRRSQVISLSPSIVLLYLWAFNSSAHHSHAEFSDESQIIEGELSSIAWRNPHPSMTLRVSDRETWTVQVLGNINGLRK